MAKKNNGRFGGLIDQMNRDRHHLILVSLDTIADFTSECERRGYDIKFGSKTENGQIVYKSR